MTAKVLFSSVNLQCFTTVLGSTPNANTGYLTPMPTLSTSGSFKSTFLQPRGKKKKEYNIFTLILKAFAVFVVSAM